MALSYFDVGASVAQPMQAEVATASQDAMALQAQKRLAVLPQPNLRSAIQAAGQRQQGQIAIGQGERRLGIQQQELGIGERRLGLESRRAQLGIDQTNYERSMAPYQIGLGAAAGGLGLYRGYRDLQQGKLQEDMLRRNMAIQEETGRLGAGYAGDRVTMAGLLRDLYARQATTDRITETNLMPTQPVATGRPWAELVEESRRRVSTQQAYPPPL